MSVKYICSMFKIQLRKMFLFVRFCLLVSFGSFLSCPFSDLQRMYYGRRIGWGWVGGGEINQRKGEHIWTYYRYGKLFIYLTEILTLLTQHIYETNKNTITTDRVYSLLLWCNPLFLHSKKFALADISKLWRHKYLACRHNFPCSNGIIFLLLA